jgi:hypothetical protein
MGAVYHERSDSGLGEIRPWLACYGTMASVVEFPLPPTTTE